MGIYQKSLLGGRVGGGWRPSLLALPPFQLTFHGFTVDKKLFFWLDNHFSFGNTQGIDIE